MLAWLETQGRDRTKKGQAGGESQSGGRRQQGYRQQPWEGQRAEIKSE